jgi:hypothetical protein
MGVGNSYQDVAFQVMMDRPVVCSLNALKKKGEAV